MCERVRLFFLVTFLVLIVQQVSIPSRDHHLSIVSVTLSPNLKRRLHQPFASDFDCAAVAVSSAVAAIVRAQKVNRTIAHNAHALVSLSFAVNEAFDACLLCFSLYVCVLECEFLLNRLMR